MGAKKRNSAVDRQQRSGQVKTRLAANKSSTAAATPKKPQKVTSKTASKKTLPIKKRISKEKFVTDLVKKPAKPRSTSKSKKADNEPSTSAEAGDEKKPPETSPEVEVEPKPAIKDGKTKAISKMLKSLDIQISGFANILPPEERIVEVLKSSISENVKTKSRAAAVKVSNAGAIGKFSSKKDFHVEKKGSVSSNSSSVNSPSASGEQETKSSDSKPTETSSKTESSLVGQESDKTSTSEGSTSKEALEPLIEHKGEEPVVETKKKIAAKKARLEANKNKKKLEEAKDEPKEELAPTQEPAMSITIEPESKECKKDDVDIEKKKTKSTKSMELEKEPSATEPPVVEKESPSPQTAPQKPLPKAVSSPKKIKQNTKVSKGKCNEDDPQNLPTPSLETPPSSVIGEPAPTLPPTKEPQTEKKDIEPKAISKESTPETENTLPKVTKPFTIHQRLQNKYKMNPVKSKPSLKSAKKIEQKGPTKKPLSKPATDEKKDKKDDIYDFRSGSESEENIKMELPTLKQLREFSDDDDKPLQVTKKKLKEDLKDVETPVAKNETKLEAKTESKTEDKPDDKVEKKDVKLPSKPPAEKKPAKAHKKPPPKAKPQPPPESQSDEKSSSTSDSEDEQKLSTFGQKRHRMASLNALAKVQCLYENESRTAYELGLSKMVQVVPKIRTLNSGSSSEEEKEVKMSIKKEPSPMKEPKKSDEVKVEPSDDCSDVKKEEEVEVETKRELRNVPGRGMGKHWEFESDTDNEALEIEKMRLKKKKLQKLKALQAKKEKKEKVEDKSVSKPKKPVKPIKKSVKIKIVNSDDGSSESSDHEDKKKAGSAHAIEKIPAEPKKKRKRDLKEELIGDYKGILARKRMASLNASAIVAATYEVERHLDRNLASDCSSFESFPEEEKQVSKKSKKQTPLPQPPAAVDTKETKETKDIKVDPSEGVDVKDTKDFKESVKEAKETTRPTSTSLVIVQDTDVTITGVYVNPTTGSSQEAYCKMQYRVQSSVTEERVLRPGSVEPPKSYTPLGALSSMRPPGAAAGTDVCSSPPAPVTVAPPIIESINHPNIYQPNDLSHHDPSEHSHYSYHHMSPSAMSIHPHSTDHASQMHHYGAGHQVSTSQAPTSHHYHAQQQPPPTTSMSQGRCESPVLYGGGYQPQHPSLSMTAGGGSSAFCAPPSIHQQQQQQQQQQHHDMSGKFITFFGRLANSA